MVKDLIINSTPTGVEIALLEDKKLVELNQDKHTNSFSVGDILLGKVKKIIPGLNAAFIDVGYEKDAFLHYTDLGPQVRSLIKYTNQSLIGKQEPLLANFQLEKEIVKTGKIADVLNKKNPVLVQILKEPISNKGPRISCDISLAGRFLVLTPFNNTVGVSKKIVSSDERKRLERLISSIKPKNFGVIIRTVAEGKSVAELHEDLQHLVDKWTETTKQLKNAVPPVKILSEINRATSILRDLLNDTFNSIVSNDENIFSEVKSYITRVAPDKEKIVSFYDGNIPLFDHFGITKQIKSSFGKTVSLHSGPYLIIEHTEALHVIDVNSGHKMSNSGNLDANALGVNMEASEEIVRQLRLRDMGGIIIIDFIDMRNPDNKKKLFQKMIELMKNDRAQHTVLPLSKFGLMQITRQRVRPEINISTTEECPSCSGTGKIGASILIMDEIENNLRYILKEQNQSGIKLQVHTFIEAYINKGFPSLRTKWWMKYKKRIQIFSTEDMHITEYHFYDKSDEEIKI